MLGNNTILEELPMEALENKRKHFKAKIKYFGTKKQSKLNVLRWVKVLVTSKATFCFEPRPQKLIPPQKMRI